MTLTRARTAGMGLASIVGLAAASYATLVGASWLRYGHVVPAAPDDTDPYLDRFMPDYEVVERHRIRVAAPVGVTFGALVLGALLAGHRPDSIGVAAPCTERGRTALPDCRTIMME